MTPERKAELRLLLDSRVEKWKSDVGWWAAVAEELLDALGAREQTPTAGGAQAGRADEAADTAGASAAGEKPGALTLAYEYLRSWRAHHVASGKSAAHLAGFDEALTHLAAAPEREIQPPAPVALPGLSEGELVREAMGLLMAATTDQVLIHIIDLRADYQQLVRERGEAWLATKTEAPVALPEAEAVAWQYVGKPPRCALEKLRDVDPNMPDSWSPLYSAATVRALQRALTAAERTISQHDAEDFEHIQKGLAREAKLSELQRERDEASELANQTARMQADSTDASVSAEMAWMLECDTAIREQDEARAEVTTLRTRVNLDALGGHEADAVALVEARAEVARVTAERDAFRDNAQAAIRLVVERVTPGEANRLTAELARLGEEYDHLDHDTRNKLESLAYDHAKAVAERDDARGKLERVAAILHTARDPGPGGWSENRAVQAALALLEE